MSGAFGYRFCPISVFPLPLLAWQIAQWAAKWALASAINSGEGRKGFFSILAFDGTASFRAVRATYLSNAEGWSRALKPRRTAATAPATTSITAASTSSHTNRFLRITPPLSLRLHGRRGRGHVEFAHRLVHFPWTAGRLQTISQKKTFQRDRIAPEGFQGHDVVGLELEQSPLRDQHLRVCRRHPPITLHIELIGFLGTRDHPAPIFLHHRARGQVVLNQCRRTFAQYQLDALHFPLGAFDVGAGSLHVPLVAVEDGNLHADLGEPLQTDRPVCDRIQFAVLLKPAPKLQIGDRFTPRPSQRRLRSEHTQLRDLDGWTVLQKRLQPLVGIVFGQVCEIANKVCQRHHRFPDCCRQRAPNPQLLLLRRHHRQLRLLPFDFGLQHVGLVCLSHVAKLLRSVHRVFRQLAQLAPQIHHLLCGQSLVIKQAHAIDDPQPLLLSLRFRLFFFLFKHAAVQSELPAEDDVLAHEEALFPSTLGPATRSE